jgi:hypothetical protein
MVEVAKNLQVIGTIKCHLWVSLYARAIQFAQTHEFVFYHRPSQAPIKLLFPKNFNPADEGKNFSMLGTNCILAPSSTHTQTQFHACSGLGDIVIPGIFLALLLRFDAIHKTRT